MTRKPPIGVPRVYDGAVCPVIHPGEVARAQFDQGALRAWMADPAQYGKPFQLPVTGWLVEPAPGWYARWLRLRYRILGDRFASGPPKLEVTGSIVERRPR